MKKIFLFLFFIFFTCNIVKADVMPFYMDTIKYPGMGVLNVTNEFSVYKEPTMASDVLVTGFYDINGVFVQNKRYQINKIFVAFSPRNNLAFATVLDENDNGWYNICYNQETGENGWIYNSNEKDFFVWKDFYSYYGRRYGIYGFKDIPDDLKHLYSGPGDDSQKLQTYTYAKHIKLNIIRGNWALVTLLDLHNVSKIGWLKWRSPEGKLYYFPSIQKL